MIRNHNFEIGDTVVFEDSSRSVLLTIGKYYVVLETGFFSVKVVNDLGLQGWVSASAFGHTPKVTMTRGHLKRIVFGR